MAPFIQEDNVKMKSHEENFRSMEMDLMSTEKIMSDRFMSENIFEEEEISILSRIRDKKLMIVGGSASILIFLAHL